MMRALRRRRPSSAIVLACAALFVALGETTWATVSALVPRNSVGTEQLRTGAVTSAKIKNGGVALVDLAPAARRPGKPGPAGPPGAAGAPGPQGPAGAVTKLWAVMNASGSLARTSGATSAGRLGPGSYEILFNQDVRECAFVGSIGDPSTTALISGTLGVSRRAGNPNGVRIDTRSVTGVLSNRPFHLLVVC
jgi:hypothetical protein